MPEPTARSYDALANILEAAAPIAIAVSGGVDSMTLAHVAHRALGTRATMMHAVSPAVPARATNRVHSHAKAHDWRLEVLDAGEFDDDDYRRNPLDRCFHCKKNLYASIAARSEGTLASGTNTDDLGDFRPGLQAAAQRNVMHPFVDVGMDKAAVRALAAHMGLADLAELPASPCLASRVETGIAIDPATLAMIEEIEEMVVAAARPRTARCRVRRDAIVLELDASSLNGLEPLTSAHILRAATEFAGRHGIDLPVYIEPYRMGSAFLREGQREGN